MRERLDHSGALSALRRHLFAHQVVTGELLLPALPDRREEVTRVEFEERRGGGVGRVVVVTDGSLTAYSVVDGLGPGRAVLELSGAVDPEDPFLAGASNAAVSRLHDLALASESHLASAPADALERLGGSHRSWFSDAPTLTRWAASASVEAVEAVTAVLTDLAAGTPLEWALRRSERAAS